MNGTTPHWVEEQGVGLVVAQLLRRNRDAVRTLLAPENYERFRKRAAQMRNSAVYEIPDLLEGILSSRPLQSAAPKSGIPSLPSEGNAFI